MASQSEAVPRWADSLFVAGTVPTEVSELSFTGNGVAVAFPLPFPILATSDLVVTLTPAGGVATLQVEGVNYTVSEAPSDAPIVTMTVAPPAASTLRVRRTVAITQVVNLRTQGPFSPATVTEMLDKRTMVEQQLARRIAALEAIAGLVSLATLDAQLVDITFTTAADDVANTFAGGVLTVAVALAVGESVTGVLVARVQGGLDEDARLAVTVRDWSWAAGTLTVKYVTGLQVDTEYTLSLLCLSMVP